MILLCHNNDCEWRRDCLSEGTGCFRGKCGMVSQCIQRLSEVVPDNSQCKIFATPTYYLCFYKNQSRNFSTIEELIVFIDMIASSELIISVMNCKMVKDEFSLISTEFYKMYTDKTHRNHDTLIQYLTEGV